MALDGLLGKLRSLFGRTDVAKPVKNEGMVAKKPFRGLTQSELEKGIYVDMQDYHDGQITNASELQKGRKYKWFFGDGKSTHLIFRGIEKENILMESVVVPGHKKLYYLSELGIAPVKGGIHDGKWKKGHYLMLEK